MGRRKRIELRPRNGRTLVVGIVARISGGPNQKEQSLEDQVDHAKRVVADLYDGRVEYEVIKTTAKGERLDRPELGQVEALLRSRRLDLLIVEDLGRLVRGVAAAWLCGIAVDHGTRVLAPNDCVDTTDDTWEEDVIQACRDHVGHNRHTSERLKDKLMNRFTKFGGATARRIFGYNTPPGAKTYDDWRLDPAATPIYREWFRRLREDPNSQAVADWLNGLQVPTGPYTRCKDRRWTGPMVRRITKNPLLKGMPGRGFKVTIKHHQTGRRIAVRNPDGPVLKEFAHLAHVPPAEFDALNAFLNDVFKGCGRKPVDGQDPRKGVAKKRTVFPGQHARCGVCGRWYYWGGHGQTDHLMCAGNREYQCWNGVSFDGRVGGLRIAAAVLAAVEALPGYDAEFEARVRAQAATRRGDRAAAMARLAAERADVERVIGKLVETVEEHGGSPALAARLRDREARLQAIDAELTDLRARPPEVPDLPPVGELKELARVAVGRVATADPEFGRVMRVLVPELLIFPFKDIDSGRVVARARVTVDLAGLLPVGLAEDAAGLVQTHVWVSLFGAPERVARVAEVVARRAEAPTLRDLAAALGTHLPTVQRALKLHRLMQARGLTEPYELLVQPPAAATRLKRHVHPRYRFEPLPGFPRWLVD